MRTSEEYSEEYVVKTKRAHCLLGILLAAALLYLGLDLHFSHSLKGWRVTPNSPIWIFLSAGGFLLLVYSLKSFVSPKLLLKADTSGITIYAGNLAFELGPNSTNKPPRKGDPRLIPWNQIRQIGRGKMVTGKQIRKGTGCSSAALGGTITVGAKHNQTFTEALQVLCDNSLQLEGFGTSGLSVAWNGYSDNDLRLMSKRDRESLTAESLYSGFLFRHSYLNGGLDHTLAVLDTLRKKFSTA